MEKKSIVRRTSKCVWLFGTVMCLVFLWSMKIYAAEPEQIVYEGPIFTEGSEILYPDEILEEGGKTYQLISAELQSTEKRGVPTYVSTSIPYELEGNQEPPERAVVTLKDEETGKEYEREVYLQEVQEKERFWRDDFSFPITVYGYGADVFFLNGQEIPADADLIQYGWLLLEYLELSSDYYRIETVEWDGESYEEEGTLCRDAIAYGEKLIRNVNVLYGGQVRTLDVPAKQYVAVYEEVLEEEETDVAETETAENIEVIEETTIAEEVTSKNEGFSERIMRWIREHITAVVLSGLFLLGMMAWVLLLYESGKKKGEAGD